jgi:hypothetical protein
VLLWREGLHSIRIEAGPGCVVAIRLDAVMKYCMLYFYRLVGDRGGGVTLESVRNMRGIAMGFVWLVSQ